MKANSIDEEMKRERLADIYRRNSKMKKGMNTKLLRFYLLAGIGYFFMGLLTTVGGYPGHFEASLLNNIWGCLLLTVLNFILFEYSIPFVLKKRKFLLYNIVAGI